MKKRWIVAGIVVLAGGVAAPWAVGVVTEQQWQEAAREVNASQPFFQVETAGYRRGLFSADLNGTLLYHHPETGEPLRLSYHGTASHGVTGSLLEFTAAELPAGLAPLFPDEQPRLTLETRLWGTAVAELTVPAISLLDDATGESIKVAETVGTATIRDGGNAAEISLLWPGAALQDGASRISVENVRFQQSMTRLQGDVWTGTGDLTLARLAVTAGEQPPVGLDSLAVHSETRAGDGGTTITTEGSISLQSLTADGESSGPHRVDMVLEDFDVAGWNSFIGAMTDLQAVALDPAADPQQLFEQQMAAMGQMTEALRTLAANGMVFGFPSISLTTPEGEVSGELLIRHPALSDDEKAEMLMVMQRLTGDFRVSLPVALSERYPQLKGQLLPLIEQGMVVQEGDRLVLRARLQDLTVDVNGTLIPLPQVI